MIIQKEQIFAWLANIESNEASACLDAINIWLSGIEGSWNGDDAGQDEDRAMITSNARKKLRELKEIMDQL